MHARMGGLGGGAVAVLAVLAVLACATLLGYVLLVRT